MLPPDDRFKIEYKEVADNIRHYSATRSALTSFLMTASLTAFATYLKPETPATRSPFLLVVGHLLLVMAALACWVFSHRTEKNHLYLSKIWNWSKQSSGDYPEGFKSFSPSLSKVLGKMAKDSTNWLMLIALAVILLALWFPNLFRMECLH